MHDAIGFSNASKAALRISSRSSEAGSRKSGRVPEVLARTRENVTKETELMYLPTSGSLPKSKLFFQESKENASKGTEAAGLRMTVALGAAAGLRMAMLKCTFE